jgi:hypothetical protein
MELVALVVEQFTWSVLADKFTLLYWVVMKSRFTSAFVFSRLLKVVTYFFTIICLQMVWIQLGHDVHVSSGGIINLLKLLFWALFNVAS